MIFISYSWEDKEVMPVIERTFDECGQSYWIDHINLDLGSCLTTQIKNAIEKCSEVVFVSSKNSVRSPWVKYELEVAMKLGKTVLTMDASKLEKKRNKEMHPTVYAASILRSRCHPNLP